MSAFGVPAEDDPRYGYTYKEPCYQIVSYYVVLNVSLYASFPTAGTEIEITVTKSGSCFCGDEGDDGLDGYPIGESYGGGLEFMYSNITNPDYDKGKSTTLVDGFQFYFTETKYVDDCCPAVNTCKATNPLDGEPETTTTQLPFIAKARAESMVSSQTFLTVLDNMLKDAMDVDLGCCEVSTISPDDGRI
jgi:hypothetical protein